MNKTLNKVFLFICILTLAACGGSSSSKDKGGSNKINAKAACDAETAQDFFAALEGEFNIKAVDNFKEGGSHADSDTDTFDHGTKYMVRIETHNDLDLTIDTKLGEVVLTYNEELGDTFEVMDVGGESVMIQAVATFALRVVTGGKHINVSVGVPCEDDLGDPWFINYMDGSTVVYDDMSFSWRLDTGA